MADVGKSTRAGQKDLPNPCGEKRELRQMVQERDEEIERLRGALKVVAQTTDPRLTHDEDTDLVGVLHDLHHCVVDALDGGGDNDE